MFQLTNELLIIALLFVVIFFLSYKAIKMAIKEKGISIVASLSITLIVIFFISNSELNFLTNLYGSVGTIVLTIIPLIIAFFFIYTLDIGGPLRKIFWVFYGIITIFLIQNNYYLPSEDATGTILLILFLIILIISLDNIIKNKVNTVKNLKRNR